MKNLFNNIWRTIKAILIILLIIVLSIAAGYLLGSRALDRDKLEDEIRAELESEVRDEIEALVREDYEDRLEQAEKLRDEELQSMIDALLDDIDSRVNGIDTESQLQDFNTEVEFGI